jgi:uncharacterized membrane protein YhaH (DUF805 family)
MEEIMGSFSIWHWLIVVAYIATVVVPVAAASYEKRISRKDYAIRVAAFFGAVIVLSVVGQMIGDTGQIVALALGYVFAIFIYIWSVHRTQDIGWSRWLNLLMIVPIVALIWWLILLFTPSPSRNESLNPLP